MGKPAVVPSPPGSSAVMSWQITEGSTHHRRGRAASLFTARPGASVPSIQKPRRNLAAWLVEAPGHLSHDGNNALLQQCFRPMGLPGSTRFPAEDRKVSYKLRSKRKNNFLGLFLIDRADVDPHWVCLGCHNLCQHVRSSPRGHNQPSVQTPWSSGGICVCPAFSHV